MTTIDNSLEPMLQALTLYAWEYMGNHGHPPPERIPTADDLWAFADELLPGVPKPDTLHKLNAEWVAERDRAKAAGQGFGPHPLLKLVQTYLEQPRKWANANIRPDRILPASIGMVTEDNKKAGRLLNLFKPAAHVNGQQMALPGFASVDIEQEGPALPLALYELGEPKPQHGGGRGAPLALRLFVEAILAAPYHTRPAGEPVGMDVTLRELLAQLYPGPRRPKPNEYYPRLVRAVEALDSMDARLPWQNPLTGQGGLRRVVSVTNIPRGPGRLDDLVRVVVDVPPGSGPGPVVSPRLGLWGTKSAPAYNALLNLAYRWWNPGVTRVPIERKSKPGSYWAQVEDPERYPELTDADVVAVTRPRSTRATRRHLVAEGWETLHQLQDAGELRIEGRRVMPPLPPPKPAE